jgi:hypothetical protein
MMTDMTVAGGKVPSILTTPGELEALYGQPHERAVRKEISHVSLY